MSFKLLRTLNIAELSCTLKELVHEPTGAQVMYIGNDDPENLFCCSFRTLPDSSNGAPHILEHTVLCGSKKYPVKDPFFAMTRRSLNTFMNAFTGPDFTCYPAASQVRKDFYNLFEVYLDAVFHPLLKETSFLQEGHRLELEDPKNLKSPLLFRGVVFNEMKGSLGSPETRLWHAMMEALVPDLPYAYNSGGDPEVIPSLTYTQLVDFWKRSYHPSHCLFFFYGNLPLEHHLEFLEEKCLKGVERLPELAPIPPQKRFTQPKKLELRYPIAEAEDLSERVIVSFGWLTLPISKQEELLALQLLDLVLMETDAAPLKRALITSGLCHSADALLDTEMSEVPYLISCKGCRRENVDKLEEFLLAEFKKIAASGIPRELIDGALHQLAFHRFEINGGGGSPFGLTLFMRAALSKQHGCPPERSLMVHTLFEKLERDLKDPHFLSKLIHTYFIDNPHRVRIALLPDPQLTTEEELEERKRLHALKEKLTEKDLEEIAAQQRALEKVQKRSQGKEIDLLPKIHLSDVPRAAINFDVRKEQREALQVIHHDCFTNGIVYADLHFDVADVTLDELPYLFLLASLIPELGQGKRTFMETLSYIQRYTGGVGSSLTLHVQVDDANHIRPSFSLRGKALERNVDKLFHLFHEMAVHPRLDEEARVHELLQQWYTSLHTRLTRNAIRYAREETLSSFSGAAVIQNLCEGLPYFQLLRVLADDEKPHALLERLTALVPKLMTFATPTLVLSSSESSRAKLEKEKFFGLADLPPSKLITPWQTLPPPQPTASKGRPIPSPVAFTVEAHRAPHLTHPAAPALFCAMRLFDNTILHPEIREEGGAYGCGATYVPPLGAFTFHSYRDPHIATTLATFRRALDKIARGAFDERELEEAKLEIIQALDLPVPPGARASTTFHRVREGKTPERRQAFRDTLLALTKHDVQRAVQEELLPSVNEGITVSFASQELLEKENGELAQKGLPPLPIEPPLPL